MAEGVVWGCGHMSLKGPTSCPHCEDVRLAEMETIHLRLVVSEFLMNPYTTTRDGLIAALDKRNQHYEARCLVCGGPSAWGYVDILGDGPVCVQHGEPEKTQKENSLER